MIQYQKILELYFNGVSQRTIRTSVGSSRNTVSDVIQRAKNLSLIEMTEEKRHSKASPFGVCRTGKTRWKDSLCVSNIC